MVASRYLLLLFAFATVTGPIIAVVMLHDSDIMALWLVVLTSMLVPFENSLANTMAVSGTNRSPHACCSA